MRSIPIEPILSVKLRRDRPDCTTTRTIRVTSDDGLLVLGGAFVVNSLDVDAPGRMPDGTIFPQRTTRPFARSEDALKYAEEQTRISIVDGFNRLLEHKH